MQGESKISYFLFLMLMTGIRRHVGFKISFCDPRDKKILLNLVGTAWNSLCMTVLWKLLNTFGLTCGSYLIVFCHKAAEIHSFCIQLIN